MSTKGRLWAGMSAAATIVALLSLGFDASAQDIKKKPAGAVSACKGLDERACKSKASDCLWIVPKKGKQKPYCRLKARKKG